MGWVEGDLEMQVLSTYSVLTTSLDCRAHLSLLCSININGDGWEVVCMFSGICQCCIQIILV